MDGIPLFLFYFSLSVLDVILFSYIKGILLIQWMYNESTTTMTSSDPSPCSQWRSGCLDSKATKKMLLTISWYPQHSNFYPTSCRHAIKVIKCNNPFNVQCKQTLKPEYLCLSFSFLTGLTGNIINHILDAGFEISALQMVRLHG